MAKCQLCSICRNYNFVAYAFNLISAINAKWFFLAELILNLIWRSGINCGSSSFCVRRQKSRGRFSLWLDLAAQIISLAHWALRRYYRCQSATPIDWTVNEVLFCLHRKCRRIIMSMESWKMGPVYLQLDKEGRPSLYKNVYRNLAVPCVHNWLNSAFAGLKAQPMG